jgi:hypothetical protein
MMDNIQIICIIYEYLDIINKEKISKCLNYSILYEKLIEDIKIHNIEQIKIDQSTIIIEFINDALIKRTIFGQKTDFCQIIKKYYNVFIPDTLYLNSTLLQLLTNKLILLLF